jgi:hypothetical protein
VEVAPYVHEGGLIEVTRHGEAEADTEATETCCAVDNHRSIHSLPQLQLSPFLMKVQTVYAGPCVFIIHSIGEYNSQSAELHKSELKHYLNNACIVVQSRIGTGRDRRTRVRLKYLKTPSLSCRDLCLVRTQTFLENSFSFSYSCSSTGKDEQTDSFFLQPSFLLCC